MTSRRLDLDFPCIKGRRGDKRYRVKGVRHPPLHRLQPVWRADVTGRSESGGSAVLVDLSRLSSWIVCHSWTVCPALCICCGIRRDLSARLTSPFSSTWRWRKFAATWQEKVWILPDQQSAAVYEWKERLCWGDLGQCLKEVLTQKTTQELKVVFSGIIGPVSSRFLDERGKKINI